MGIVAWRPMIESEFRTFLSDGTKTWATDLVKSAGYDEESALRKATEDFADLLPNGLNTNGHFLFVIEDDDRAVGTLWFAERVRGHTQYCYIYDIRLVPEARHAGVGRTTMKMLEREARSRGYAGIELNVFADNETARSLYRSLGYDETFIRMRKEVARDTQRP